MLEHIWGPPVRFFSKDPRKKEIANGNARWNVNFFFVITTSDLIGQDSKGVFCLMI